MTDVLVLILSAALSVKTAMYGIWTLRSKNTAGGIFVLTLAAGTLFLAARYFFKA